MGLIQEEENMAGTEETSKQSYGGQGHAGRTTPTFSGGPDALKRENTNLRRQVEIAENNAAYWQTQTEKPKPKQEPVRVATVQTGGAMVGGSGLVLIMKHIFNTDLSIEDALIIVGAVGLIANWLSGEVARLKVWAPEKE